MRARHISRLFVQRRDLHVFDSLALALGFCLDEGFDSLKRKLSRRFFAVTPFEVYKKEARRVFPELFRFRTGTGSGGLTL